MHKRRSSLVSGYAEVNDLSDLEDNRFELDSLNLHSRHTSGAGNDDVTFVDTDKQAFDHDNGQVLKPNSMWGIQFQAVMYVLLWYAFSISLSVYNKYMFSSAGLDFKFPIITTAIHQLVQVVLSLLMLLVIRIPISSASFTDRVKVLPAALASAADIGLGNTSLLIVTLSFYTMIKSSALGFVLLFSVLFRLESLSWQLGLNIFIMTVGVFMMVAGEAQFSLPGFLLVLGASCASGLRWALVKILLNAGNAMPQAQSNGKAHPLQTIIAISPGMFLILAILGAAIEGYKPFVTAEMWNKQSIPLGILYIMVPGLLAFCMTWSEFELLNVTGPLSLAIAGICKEVATIFVSILAFDDRLSLVNWVGLIVTTSAIGMYHYYKLRS